MEFVEMETKEDILAVGVLERAIAPEIMGECGEYLDGIEHTVRYDSEAGTDYYLIYRGGLCGFFALRGEGDCVTVTKLVVLPEHRRRGICRRALGFIRATYDPRLLRIAAPASTPALAALGGVYTDGYYEMRYE